MSESEKLKHPEAETPSSSEASLDLKLTDLFRPFREAERMMLQSRYPELMERATAIFGSREKVADWMTTPCRALQDQIPAEMIQNGHLEDVETELGRIEHGIYV